MRIKDATADDIAYVARHMRDRDLMEFSAVLEADTREDIADILVDRYADLDCLISAWRGNRPVAVGGAVGIRPNVGSLMFLATDDFPSIVLPLTRFIRRTYFPSLEEVGIHRIECTSLDTYAEMHRWLGTLGMAQEGGPFRAYGKNGENFVPFAWVGNASQTRH